MLKFLSIVKWFFWKNLLQMKRLKCIIWLLINSQSAFVWSVLVEIIRYRLEWYIADVASCGRGRLFAGFSHQGDVCAVCSVDCGFCEHDGSDRSTHRLLPETAHVTPQDAQVSHKLILVLVLLLPLCLWKSRMSDYKEMEYVLVCVCTFIIWNHALVVTNINYFSSSIFFFFKPIFMYEFFF